MAKVHGQGGHGRHSREAQRKYEHQQKVHEHQKRAVERAQRKFTAQAERAVQEIVVKGEKEIVPIANRAKQKLEETVRRGGINIEGYVLRILAVDKFVVDEMKRLFSENAVTKEYLSDINWENYHWLKSEERSYLLLQVIGKNPRVKKQQRILNQIAIFSKRAKEFANGKL